MTPANRNRLLAVFALLLAGGGLAYIAFGNLGQNLVYYWTPQEMLAKGDKAYGAAIRLGGVVKPGSVKPWDQARSRLEFEVATDHKPEATAVRVIASQVPPQMFRDGIGVVVEGKWDRSQTFNCDRLIVNHSNEYRAPKEGEAPKDWRETLDEGEAASGGPKAEVK
jgi:cytochrome c-type biogenesis protein CcmE